MICLSKFPFFDSVDNALSDLVSAAKRLDALAVKHRDKAIAYQKKASANNAAADRAVRVSDKLHALTE